MVSAGARVPLRRIVVFVSIGIAMAPMVGCSVTLDPTVRVENDSPAETPVATPPPSEPTPSDAPGDGGVVGGGSSLGDSGGGPSLPTPITLVTSSPTTGATGVETETNIELVFDRDIAVRTGNFTLYRTVDGSSFESVDVTSSGVTVEGAILTVDLDGVLAGNTTYTITLDEGAVEGADGTGFEGIGVDEMISFTTGSAIGPGDVSNGLVLWLDAAFTASLKVENGRVAVWGDRSGNNASVQQTDSSAQPTLLEAAIDANAAVRFDGSSDVLEGPVLEPLQEYEVFVVWQSTLEPPSGGQTHLLRNGASLEINHGHDQLAFRYAGASQFDTTWISAQFEPPATNTVHTWNLSFDSTAGTLTAFTNGSISATSTGLVGSSLASAEPLTVGSRWGLARHFTGDIGEVLLYRRALDEVERTAVQGYLDEKWRP